jgi:DUF4097 and DUF4098 domain-containing protein YvlB
MNNNKKVWFAMGIFLGAILILCIFMVLSMPRGRFYIGGGNAMLRHTENIVIDEKTALDLTAYSENIFFLQSDSDELVIKEYYHQATKKADIRKSGNSVTIRCEQEYGILSWGMGKENDRIEIYLPAHYAGSMNVKVSSGAIKSDLNFTGESLSFASNSGSIHLNDLTAAAVNIKASSGSIKAADIAGAATVKSNSGSVAISRIEGPADINSSSGSIKIGELKGDATVKANSGAITIEGLEGLADIEASSGSIKVFGVIGSVTAKANSGAVRIEVDELKGNVSATTSSGGVNIDLPKNSAFQFSAETSSGSIKTDFDASLSFNSRGNKASGTVGGDAAYLVSAKANSGSVKVIR